MERKDFTLKRIAQALVFVVGVSGLALLGREAVDYLDSSMQPKYVLKGDPALPIEDPVWNRPTDWNRKVGSEKFNIHFVDGRK